ncbi:DUF3168 domain-containing protein [Halomonas caseinilytica]|uniref:DUF3168 domain-containing protein n=1 Tax=Halomonas caseinilytica TaxID=438744 RepID=A0A1M6UH49_9GAMM|nr:DUF3168 domain-containing protein [Halomonas caseinilytica]SHK68483.1 Protein of unknown function [Halomonas caseinilytica]
MFPPIYALCTADSAVSELLGSRLYPAGDAPQGVALPYAVWQIIPGGAPENYLADRPDADSYTLQVDVYASSVSAAGDVTEALRDVIERHAYIVRWGALDTDPDTGNRHISFDVDWIVHR